MQKDLLKNSVKGFLFSLGVSVILLALFGYVCYSMQDPEHLLLPLGVTALYASAFFGGFFSARFNKTDGLLSGAVCGLIFTLFVIMISLFMRKGEPTGVVDWLMFVSVVLVSALGGRLGVPSARRKKKRNNRK